MSKQETNVSFSEEVTKDVTSNTACIDVASSSQLSTLSSRQTSSLSQEGTSNNISRELSERLFKCCDFEWKQAHGLGTLLKRINVPKDVVSAAVKVPNGAVLMPYVYFHFDSYVKFVINCNRFQVGQLQMSWSYVADEQDTKYGSIFLNSQRPHGIYSASANNTVELSIPFKYIYPYVCLREYGNNLNLPNMATIDIRVLSPLLSNSATYDRVQGTVLFGFREFRGHGMVPLEFAFHEMLSIGVAGVEAMLKKAKNVYNLDNPSNPQAKGTIVPYASHSWANGTNVVEELNILRLDPTAITPHPNIDKNEMNIMNIVRTYGFIRTLTWRMNDPIGKVLWWTNVTPLSSFNMYPTFSGSDLVNRQLELRSLPPIAVLSSLFSNWRGGIEYRIDVIRTMMHTGRLILSYIPLARDGNINLMGRGWTTPSLDDLYGGYYVMMDYGGDENSFSFTVPYISNRPWLSIAANNRSSFGINENFHGCVFLAVVNPLIPMDSVPNYININIYIRAGFDFELSVLSKPLLGLAYNREFSYKYDKIMIKPGYYPSFAGNWRSWIDGNKSFYIMRYGEGMDHITQVEGDIRHDTYYSILGNNIKGPLMKVKDDKGKIVLKEARYFYIPYKPKDSDFGDYNYIVPCLSPEMASKGISITNPDGKAFGIEWVEDGDYWAGNNMILIPKLNKLKSSHLDVQHQMDERKIDSLTHDNTILNSHINSLQFYNESFNNLKDLCRRYQIYGESTFQINEQYGFGSVVLIIPLYPSGLKFDYTVGHLVNDSFNYTREGVIPIITSGFRYFRGGLRFKIVLTSKDSKDVVFSITHMPDCYYPPKLQYLQPEGINKDFVSSGYASYNQSTRINEIFEIEVPYYMQTDYGLLTPYSNYDYEKAKFSSLGSLAVAVMSRVEKKHDFSIQIYYSFADDMQLSEFQGFPATNNALQIPGYKLLGEDFELVEHEMFTSIKNKCNKIKQIPHKIVTGTVSSVSQGAVTGLINGLEQKKEIIGDSANILFQHLSALLDQVLGKIMDVSEKIIRGAASHLLHVLVNPQPATIITALVGFLISTGVILDKSVPLLLGALRRVYLPILQRMKAKTPSIEQHGNTSVEHEMETLMTESETSALTATAITVVAAAFGLSKFKSGTGLNFFKNVMVGIKDFSFCANSLTIFIRNNITCFAKIVKYISRKINSKFNLVEDLEDCNDKISEWARSVKVLTNPLLRDKINNDPKLQYQVFIRDIEGQALSMRNDISEVPMAEIRSLCTKIRQIQEELVNDRICPAARQEPYVLQIFGESNIGKSYIVNEVVNRLLEAINYKTYSDPIFVRTAGTNYWNGVNRQPCVWMDDVFCVTTGEICQEQMREIFALKSSSVFNPPIAELENKKLRYNPKIVMMTSNEAFWTLIGLSEPKALYRRRDALWEARKKEEYRDIHPGSIDRKITSKFGHLEFRKSKDPSDQNASMSDWMDYDNFIKILTSDFRIYDAREMINYRRRIMDLTRLFPLSPENDLADLFESSEALLEECSERLNDLRSVKDLNEFKRTIQPMCNMSYRSAYGDQVMREDQICMEELFGSKIGEPKVEHEIFSAKPIIQDIKDGLDNFTMSPEEKQSRELSMFNYLEQYKTNNILTPKEQKLYDDLVERHGYGSNNQSSSEIIPSTSGTEEIAIEVRTHDDVNKIIDKLELKDFENPRAVYKTTTTRIMPVCNCTDTGNDGDILCDLHPVTSVNCHRTFNTMKRLVSVQPNKFKECPHVYLTPEYFMDDNSEESDKVKYLRDYADVKHFKISENFCERDCVLRTREGRNVIRCFAELTTGSPTSLMNCENAMIMPGVPNFIKETFSYLLDSSQESDSGESYVSLLEKVPLIPINPPKTLKQRFEEFCNNDTIRKIWKILKTILKWLGLAVVSIGMIYTVFTIGRDVDDAITNVTDQEPFRPFLKDKSTSGTPSPWQPPKSIKFLDQNHELFQSGSISTRGSKPNKIERQRAMKDSVRRMAFVQPESSSVDSRTDDILNLLARNLAYLSYFDGYGKEIFKQRLLGLGAGYALTTKHFIQGVEKYKITDPKGNIIVRRGTSKIRYRWEQVKTIIHDDSSFALINFPGPLTFKNILKHIADSDEHSIINGDALFINYDENRIFCRELYLSVKNNLHISANENCSAQDLAVVYSYNYHGNGLCGSPILSLKPFPRIIGIHVAGSSSLNQGYAQPIMREYFDNIKFTEIAELPVDHQMRISPMFNLENDILLLGTIPRQLSVHLPSKSKIVPTPMFDQIVEHTTEPAPLSNKDVRIKDHLRSPIVEGIAKHGLAPLPFDHKILDECQRDLSEILQRCRPVMLSKSKELLSDQEIFGGVIGNDNFGKIELNSSEGYPLILQRPENFCNKKWLFEYEDKQDQTGLLLKKINPVLDELIKYNNSLRSSNKVPSQVFYDCLKDARIDKEKIKIPGKTRVFSVAPIEYTWTMKKYFGQFQAAFASSRFSSETAIGINPQSSEWTILYNYLTSNSENIIVGDYKSFGDRLYWYCIELAFKTIREWYSFHYGDHHNNVRKILELELRYSTRLVGNVAYRVICGIPSGFPLTVEINNMVNQLYMRYCFKKITSLPMSYFNRYCRLVCYGDDLIMSISDAIIDKYNFNSIQKELLDVSIEFTPADKSDQNKAFWRIGEVTFLKSKFVKHPIRSGVIIPQLPLSSCVEELNWMWEGNDEILTCYEAARGSLNNLYGHGPEKFDEIRKKILKWFSLQDRFKFEVPHLLTWTDIDNRIFGEY